MSSLGPVSLASQSVLLGTASTSYQAPFALSVAASVRYDFIKYLYDIDHEFMTSLYL